MDPAMVGLADALIAATAEANNAKVATLNKTHFPQDPLPEDRSRGPLSKIIDKFVYVTETKKKLSAMAIGREIISVSSAIALREQSFPCDSHFDTKNNVLKLKNTFHWDILYEYSNT